MKQVAQNYRTGELAVLEVPPPACRAGGVLVRTLYSLISTGTELMKVTEARLSLLGKARARPDQVRKVLDSVAQQGPVATYKKAISTLDSYTPLGYSLCGVVVEVGAGAEEFAVGDLVAAAGNDFALHAELNWVPINLCVPVPQGVAAQHAAFATVGAIAMQGVRRGEPQLGEVACVIGLGLVGQLTVRLLIASGVRVVGIDTVPERCRLAEAAGAVACAGPDPEGTAHVEQALSAVSGGLGADQVYLAAGGDTNGPVELAARLARDRARVVDIGKTRLDLPWNAYYEKEIDVRFSRSYGPGRYDDRYELEGIDYPAGYVRWTERRNLTCFLDLLGSGDIEVASLVSGTTAISEAPDIYGGLRERRLHGVGYLFEYPPPSADLPGDLPADPDGAIPAERNGARLAQGHTGAMLSDRAVGARSPEATSAPARHPRTEQALGVGFIGAGSYATSMLLPHLVREPRVQLSSVATTRPLSAVNAQRKFGFERVTTDPDDILSDPAIDAVFVVTRHHSHADFVCRALQAGKAVFVEKPLALTHGEVDRIAETVRMTGNDRVMVGFNRRFAPLFSELRGNFGSASEPMTLRYLVNAGRLDASSWYLNEDLEGSRFLGEGGHFIDVLTAWTGALPVDVTAHETSNGQGLHVLLRYADGSLGAISYLTDGSRKFPKETLDITGSGRTARLDNFTRATVWNPTGKTVKRSLKGPDKGQRAELEGFVVAIREGAPMPIDLGSILSTTRATIAVGDSLASGRPVIL
ncbi:MAG: bi-domain-containing oxidoreductase [Intrasporangium sp.]|uniref:bi-domain-containing oxidoreductase n=1 Tax=Intrasporangium sp. TaxID=1925024 RepID=UPI003F7DA17F